MVRKSSILFSVIFSVHLVASFIAWSFAPGNVAGRAVIVSVAWKTLSFPLFEVLSEPILTAHFGVSLAVNSLLWAVTITAAIALVSSRRP